MFFYQLFNRPKFKASGANGVTAKFIRVIIDDDGHLAIATIINKYRSKTVCADRNRIINTQKWKWLWKTTRLFINAAKMRKHWTKIIVASEWNYSHTVDFYLKIGISSGVQWAKKVVDTLRCQKQHTGLRSDGRRGEKKPKTTPLLRVPYSLTNLRLFWISVDGIEPLTEVVHPKNSRYSTVPFSNYLRLDVIDCSRLYFSGCHLTYSLRSNRKPCSNDNYCKCRGFSNRVLGARTNVPGKSFAIPRRPLEKGIRVCNQVGVSREGERKNDKKKPQSS